MSTAIELMQCKSGMRAVEIVLCMVEIYCQGNTIELESERRERELWCCRFLTPSNSNTLTLFLNLLTSNEHCQPTSKVTEMVLDLSSRCWTKYGCPTSRYPSSSLLAPLVIRKQFYVSILNFILVANLIKCQQTSGEWSRLVQVESNAYEEKLPHHISGHWLNVSSGEVWLAGLGPCLLTVSEEDDLIIVNTRSCHHSNNTFNIDPKNVGYVAVCAIDPSILIIHISFRDDLYRVKGFTYEYDLDKDEWSNETIECKEPYCPDFGFKPLVHCNRNNMVISVNDLQNSWSWQSTSTRWSKIPFLFVDNGNLTEVTHDVKTEHAFWNIPKEDSTYSSIWVMYEQYFFHGSILICEVCTQEVGWSLVIPNNEGPFISKADETAKWVDGEGNLWLYDGSEQRNTTDLWLFDIHLTTWTKLTFNGSGPTLCKRCVTSVIVNNPGNISFLIVDQNTEFMAYWKLRFAIPNNITAYTAANASQSEISSIDYSLNQFKSVTVEETESSGTINVPWHHTDIFGPLIFFGTSISIFTTFGIIWFLYRCVHCPKTVRLLTDSHIIPQYSVLDAESLLT